MSKKRPPTTTNDSGIPVASDEHSLTVGPNGPTVLGVPRGCGQPYPERPGYPTAPVQRGCEPVMCCTSIERNGRAQTSARSRADDPWDFTRSPIELQHRRGGQA